jgi:hypothetical protein
MMPLLQLSSGEYGEIFNLPALNERDGGSNAMSDCFDLAQHPLPPPH